MKKTLSLCALFCLVGGGLSACVENKNDVVMSSIISGECEPSGNEFMYFEAIYCNPKNMGSAWGSVQVRNYITGESPWSSSGGGSGTTFETQIPNPGMIYVKKSVLKCKSIDGDASLCNGTDEITYNMNIPASGGGGGACVAVNFDFDVIYGQWPVPEDSVVEVEYYVEYVDSGNIKNHTTPAFLTMKLSSDYPVDCAAFAVPPKDEEDESQEPVT